MKNFFKALMLATALTFFGPVVAHADQCLISKTDFLNKAVNETHARIFVASDKARDIIVGKINAARAQGGNDPFIVDTLMIGIFEKGGQMYVGTVMFKDTCVVIGTVKVFTPELWQQTMDEWGIDPKEFSLLSAS